MVSIGAGLKVNGKHHIAMHCLKCNSVTLMTVTVLLLLHQWMNQPVSFTEKASYTPAIGKRGDLPLLFSWDDAAIRSVCVYWSMALFARSIGNRSY